MKYTAINELDSFQFHDAEIKDIKLIDNKMLWTVSAINVMTTNSQNDNPKDMCVKDAIITFEETCINKLEFGAYTIHDSNNNLIESSEATVAKPEEYENILLESMNSYFFIFGLDELVKLDDEKYSACFNVDGGAGSYYLTFIFSKAIVEWDEYDGEAWYEHPKWKKK